MRLGWLILSSCAALLALAPAARADLLSADDQRIYKQAFDAAHNGHFDAARATATKAHDPLLGVLLQWMDYERPGTSSTFTDLATFIEAHPTWPDIVGLQRRAEALINPNVSATQLRTWFNAYPPQTYKGITADIQAQLTGNQTDRATTLIRNTWTRVVLDSGQESEFIGAYRQYIRPQDDDSRLDRMLWDRDLSAAKRQILRASPTARAIAEVRIALLDGTRGAESQIDRLPEVGRADPGLQYAHLRYLREHNQDDAAVALLATIKADPGRPELWWNERAVLARTALHNGNAPAAYAIVNGHGQIHDARAADAAWLSGWIALRFMNDPKTAAGLFNTMYASVTTPVSLARAAYWSGRAADALKQPDARHWYELAAQHGTTFYGQLAAAKLGRGDTNVLAEDPLPSAEDIAAFDGHELVRVVREMAEIGERGELPPFLLRIGTLVTSPGERAMTAELASRLARPDVAITLARRSEKEGVPLLASGYPVLALPNVDKGQRALVLGVIRQESQFHEGAVSTAGARGLMQLMPATAARVAHTLKIIFKRKDALTNALTTDPGLNIKLGTAYLNGLLSDFGGSYILAAAGYNAGPARAQEWIKTFGDPRDPSKADPVDWIEQIPFAETRDYVQRVLEGTQVYRQRLGTGGLVLNQDAAYRR